MGNSKGVGLGLSGGRRPLVRTRRANDGPTPPSAEDPALTLGVRIRDGLATERSRTRRRPVPRGAPFCTACTSQAAANGNRLPSWRNPGCKTRRRADDPPLRLCVPGTGPSEVTASLGARGITSPSNGTRGPVAGPSLREERASPLRRGCAARLRRLSSGSSRWSRCRRRAVRTAG